MQHVETIVIGGGISGLTAAYTLHRAGKSTLLLDAGPRPGGLIHTTPEKGFLIEGGPHTFPSTATEILTLCEQLNLKPKAADSKAKKRYLYLNGKLIALPTHPLQALITPVLSLPGKLRLMQEPFQPKTQADDISVAAFLEKRVGREVVENMADPFISGIYAGNIEELSLPAVFPKLWQWEQQAGSLLKGAKQAKRSVPKSQGKRQPMQLLSFSGGLEMLPKALGEALPKERQLFGRSIIRVEAAASGYLIKTHMDEQYTCRHLVIATPAFSAADLLEFLMPEIGPMLRRISYNGLAVSHLGFRRGDIPHPLDGFGCLIPRKERIPLLGTIWASSLFPERAPEEQVLLSNFIGGAHHPEISGWAPEAIQQQVLKDLQQIFKTQTRLQPIYSHTVVYTQAIPQYTIGHIQRIQAIEERLAHHPNLHLCGNYLHGIALNECVKSGLAAANKIMNR